MKTFRLLLVVAWALLPGCGGDSGDAGQGARPAHARDELIVATLADADRLDPHTVTDAASMRVIENMYSTLLRYGQAYGDFVPDLAESIELSDDQKTYTLTLVEGATFHSGRPVTAADVKFSIERIIDKQVRTQQFDAIERIDTPDVRTVVITLTHPLAPFRSYLANPMNAIVDRQAIGEDGSLDVIDAGSGAFMLADWQRDRHIVLEKHADYHVEGRPHVDRLVFRPIADQTARTTALRTGEVDLVLEVAPKDVAILQRAAGVVVESVPGTFWEYIGMNCRTEPFNDARLRKAVAFGIDREQLNKLVKFGQATPLTGAHLPPNHWASADFDLYGDPDHTPTEFLLQAAGKADGFAAELIVDSSVAYQARAAEVVKQQLRPHGIDLTIRGLESAAFFDRLGTGDFQMTVVGWMGFVDPDEWTWNLFHSEGKYNQQGYANAEVDKLLDEGRRTLDRDRRKAIYARALRIIAEEAPMAFLYVNDQTAAWRDDVVGYAVHPTATTRSLENTRFAQ